MGTARWSQKLLDLAVRSPRGVRLSLPGFTQDSVTGPSTSGLATSTSYSCRLGRPD